MITMWSHPPPKVENSLPKESTLLGLVPKTYPNLANNLSMLIKLSIQAVLRMQVISYLKHEVRELLGVWSSICKWTVSRQLTCCPGWKVCILVENLPFTHSLAEVCQLYYSITKYLKHLGEKKQTNKPHRITLQYLDTPSYSSPSQFAFFYKACDTY